LVAVGVLNEVNVEAQDGQISDTDSNVNRRIVPKARIESMTIRHQALSLLHWRRQAGESELEGDDEVDPTLLIICRKTRKSRKFSLLTQAYQGAETAENAIENTFWVVYFSQHL
jgi:hypothetical protein